VMDFCIDADQLRNALNEIEHAESRGFHYCLAVFKMISAGPCLDDCLAGYSDLIEKAHPTDTNLNWGRFQCVTRNNRFVDGKLVPSKE
jgi:hypothetical protein